MKLALYNMEFKKGEMATAVYQHDKEMLDVLE
jgi:hypothetical protein